MKVLIIGAKGMLGQELVSVFSRGNEVFGWDREEIDITKNPECRTKILELKPELLINAAAYTNVDKAEVETEIADQINGYAVGHLAKVAKELGIPTVHFSTEYVFDGENKNGYKESDIPNPVSAYGKSKLLGEEELQKNTEDFYLIRLSRLYGKSGLGKKSFVQTMLELAENKSEIEVVDEELSSPTYASDLAERSKWIVENQKPGLYHAANSGAVTWFGFAAEIFKILGKSVKLIPVKSEHFPRPAQRPKYGVLLNTKLPVMRSWQDALKEFLNQLRR